MDENEKSMLAAQTQFFEQLTEVRKELSADAKDMRNEVLGAFKEAHTENVKRLDGLAKSLEAHENKDDERFLKNDERFTEHKLAVYRWIWLCIGGATVIAVIGNVVLALWK